jgi:Zn-dependent protease with chaperone function
MRRSTKVWLWFALILCAATTVLNASYGRIPSVVVAIVSLIGLCLLLFKQKKQGFLLMCGCYVLSFVIAVVGSLSSDALLLSIVMSFVGSILVPGITWLFLRRDWNQLQS